jgi:ATP-dependent Clp protease adaptor protein ClpS
MSDTDSAVITRPETHEEHKTKRLPPYNVILLNDDDHSMEFVVMVLVKVFSYELEKCVQLMLHAHTTGRAIVWTGAKEVAELKVEQIRTFHEMKGAKNIGALGCEIEPAPGA